MLEGEAMLMRTGNEPVTARSPLRMRLWLSLWAAVWALFGLVAFVWAERPGWAAACGVLLALAVTDLALIVRHMRQGPHFQPGRDVPPYEPVREDGARERRKPAAGGRSGTRPRPER